MANGNIIVTSTINRVSWQVDQNSFTRARNKINSLKKFAESAGKSFDQATRKLQQANGKTQLQQARAETQRLKLNQRLTAEAQKQSAINARMATNEQRHAQRMAAIAARNPATGGLVPKVYEVLQRQSVCSVSRQSRTNAHSRSGQKAFASALRPTVIT
jgi:hypothetical protein